MANSKYQIGKGQIQFLRITIVGVQSFSFGQTKLYVSIVPLQLKPYVLYQPP